MHVDDNLDYDDYLIFSEKWLTKCYALAKNDGRLCMNIFLDTGKGDQLSLGADIIYIAKRVVCRYRTTVVWNEGNISKSVARGNFMSASSPHVISLVELIVVMYKEVWKKSNKGVLDTSKEEFTQWTNGL